MAGVGRRLRAGLATVRVRTTLGAVAVVGISLVVGSLVLITRMRATLLDDVRTATRLRAEEVAATVEAGGVGALGLGQDDDRVVQVVGPGGDVLAATPNLRGAPPVAQLAPGGAAEVSLDVEAEDDGADGDDFVVVAAAAETPAGRHVVLAGSDSEDVVDSTEVVTRLLVAGLPVLLGVVALTTWKVVGRALAPVEAIRSEVEGISAGELHRRVPAPAGEDEVARLARTMNAMLARLEATQARQRRFIADASHELRSPVATIRQHAEVALAHPGRSAVEELAGVVLAEDLRLQHLVEDLLVLALADEHALVLDRSPVDLDDLVLAEARRLRTTTDLAVDTKAVSAGRVDGDGAALERVLRNLADNAARHAGAVAFTLGSRDGVVLLAVDDDGPGIPSADRDRVRERFVRLDDARARGAGGAGLGLAIVEELVAAHGGTLRILDSTLGGARFELALPASADGAAGRSGRRRSAGAQDAGSILISGRPPVRRTGRRG